VPKTELEIKSQPERNIFEVFEVKLKASGYNSKAE